MDRSEADAGLCGYVAADYGRFTDSPMAFGLKNVILGRLRTPEESVSSKPRTETCQMEGVLPRASSSSSVIKVKRAIVEVWMHEFLLLKETFLIHRPMNTDSKIVVAANIFGRPEDLTIDYEDKISIDVCVGPVDCLMLCHKTGVSIRFFMFKETRKGIPLRALYSNTKYDSESCEVCGCTVHFLYKKINAT